MRNSVEKVRKEINRMLKEKDESEELSDEFEKKDLEPKEKKPDWTSIDWGRRKR